VRVSEQAAMSEQALAMVAILTVKQDRAESFRAFEERAANVMKKYGGCLERTLVAKSQPGEDTFREAHWVTFPSRDAFAAYRADPELASFQHLREESVVRTELCHGTPGPAYGS
jgi:antibiotic biosynthesis monooxygenase (ABM) superfamily enzyme